MTSKLNYKSIPLLVKKIAKNVFEKLENMVNYMCMDE